MTNFQISDMIGRTFTKVYTLPEDQLTKTELIFENDQERITFYHDQNCCESVSIEEIHGDLADLINTPILAAESKTELDIDDSYGDDQNEWTFYTWGTVKGWVDVRWFGTSNGYYSTGVSMSYERYEKLPETEEEYL